MKDMFYNYDHNINKDLQKKPFPPDYPDILESDPNISIVKDAKGREIGVRVKQGASFTLYFYLDDYTTATKASSVPNICEFIKNSTYTFELFTGRHIPVFKEPLTGNTVDIFNEKTSKLAITIPVDKARELSKDTYRMRLALGGLIGSQAELVLFDDDDGFLIVR